MENSFYSPRELGRPRFGKHLIVSDPISAQPKFDGLRVHDELWQNAKIDILDGEWVALVDRVPLNPTNKEFLTSGDEELDRDLEQEGVPLFVLIHKDYVAQYRELVDRLSYGVHLNIESGALGFFDESVRKKQCEQMTGVGERYAVVSQINDGPSPLYIFWGEKDKAVVLATEC